MRWLLDWLSGRPSAEEAVFRLYQHRNAVQYFDSPNNRWVRESTAACLRLMLGRDPTEEEIYAANDDRTIPF
ncbi:MAG: hypothetical protein U0797_01055 [Gemmataceae bacterium]